MMSAYDYHEYIRDRNDAFLSLNARRIVAHCRRYGIAVPDNPTIFWAGVHKARMLIVTLPLREREQSRDWLLAHGFYQDAYPAGALGLPERTFTYRRVPAFQSLRERVAFQFGRLAAAAA